MYDTIKQARAIVNSFGVSCYQDAQTMSSYNEAVKALGEAIAANNGEVQGYTLAYKTCECKCIHEYVLPCPNCGK